MGQPCAQKILIPVDNAPQAEAAMRFGVQLARAWGADLVGAHVYSARLHDHRFKQMEVTLPERFQTETELKRQRKLHETIIERGLRLISDSYLDVVDRHANAGGVSAERLLLEGKHHRELVAHLRENQYRVVVMGAAGMGAVEDTLLGSVAERVILRSPVDTVLVRDLFFEDSPGPIAVGIDGSPESYGALELALELGKFFQRPVIALGAYDPLLHYTVFNAMVDVLSQKAQKVFKFAEQKDLHETIIDKGLAQLYESHLGVARAVAEDLGQPIFTELLTGKASEALLEFCRQQKPFLLILGRVGANTTMEEGNTDIGSNALSLARRVPCNVWLTVLRHVPALDHRARESMAWSREALERMQDLPPEARRLAEKVVLRHAMAEGHSVLTSELIEAAVNQFMPDGVLRAMGDAARQVGMDGLLNGSWQLHFCERCGYVCEEINPASCPDCGTAFGLRAVDQTTLQALYGNHPVSLALDASPTVKWDEEAHRMLLMIPNAKQRARAQRDAENAALNSHQGAVTKGLFQSLLESIQATDY